ncbi:hypothetical protein ACJJTC_007761 [Scirpophaga incertulas]
MAITDLLNDIDNSLNITCHKVDVAEQCKELITHFKLKILTLNIRSLNRNVNEFLVVFNRLNMDFDVLVFTECWICDDSVIANIDGYMAFPSTKFINQSGGVVIYVKECWNPIVSEPDLHDANCMLIHIPNCVTVLGIYRSPSFHNTSNFLVSLENIASAMPKSPNHVITGDININILNDSGGSEYLCLLANLGFIQAVDKPTRNSACLDHFFVKTVHHMESVVCSTSVSDHDIVLLGVEQNGPSKPMPKNSHLSIDFKALEKDLKNSNFSSVLNESCPQNSAIRLEKILHQCIERHREPWKASRGVGVLHIDGLHASIAI